MTAEMYTFGGYFFLFCFGFFSLVLGFGFFFSLLTGEEGARRRWCTVCFVCIWKGDSSIRTRSKGTRARSLASTSPISVGVVRGWGLFGSARYVFRLFFLDASVTGARYSNTARITHATAWYADWAGSDLPREFLLLGIVRVAEGVTDTTPKKGLLGLKKSR